MAASEQNGVPPAGQAPKVYFNVALALAWNVTGKKFAFTKEENQEWKSRRKAKLSLTAPQPSEYDLTSHITRNSRRLNLCGDEEFNREILAPHVTPEIYKYRGWVEDPVRYLRAFATDAEARVLKFPESLNRKERQHVHSVGKELGLKTVSYGSGTKRFVVALKWDVVVFKD
ncbi:hypothetical protein HK097_008692 [Rhizophlyctis rosea]|uniref:R3H domain-containing protein n=1 Tax=Rhizophlyctis rosea TaxID=64517 RepID=A0AAD5X0X9_9FUNG|nr:hypothetical protein HK097_008692 [Rhizophlyctis rosea]